MTFTASDNTAGTTATTGTVSLQKNSAALTVPCDSKQVNFTGVSVFAPFVGQRVLSLAVGDVLRCIVTLSSSTLLIKNFSLAVVQLTDAAVSPTT